MGVKPTIDNREYNRLSSTLYRAKGRLIKEKQALGLKHFNIDMKRFKREIIRSRGKIPSLSPNPKFIRFDYVRYADD